VEVVDRLPQLGNGPYVQNYIIRHLQSIFTAGLSCEDGLRLLRGHAVTPHDALPLEVLGHVHHQNPVH